MTKLRRTAIALSAFVLIQSCGIAFTAASASAHPDADGKGPWKPPTPVDLGTLGGTYSQANAINLFGVVAGSSTIAGDAEIHGFVTADKGTLQDVGVLSGGTNSMANAVNVFSQVVGTSDYNDPINGLVQHAFRYDHGTLTDLGTLGGPTSRGFGIDAEGIVVGSSFLSDGATRHAFWFNPKKNVMNDLGTLPGGGTSVAYAINLFGLVAGSSDTGMFDALGNPITDAVIWSLVNNKSYDLGTLGGSLAQAFAINNLGAAAGASTTADGVTHAFVAISGKLKDLGTLGGTYSQANGVNDRGVVVGFSNTTGDADVHAFVWSPAKGLVDLNSLLPANSGWTLSAAYGINLAGKIVGAGTLNGESHAFVFNSGF